MVPDAAEDLDRSYGSAPAVTGPGHDGFDHPQRRRVEATDEPVDASDLRGPRPAREGVLQAVAAVGAAHPRRDRARTAAPTAAR